MSHIRLIVGLGNPGAEYQHTRHNAGFWFLDDWASDCHALWQNNGKFFGEMARDQSEKHDLLLLKPTTYMNLSGKSVLALAQYFKISRPEILVVHDELDLLPGIVRFKNGGGHGGHNGLKSLISQLGGNDFWRLRIGIGHPGDRNAVVDYVLKAPPLSEKQLIHQGLCEAANALPTFLNGHTEKALQLLHSTNK